MTKAVAMTSVALPTAAGLAITGPAASAAPSPQPSPSAGHRPGRRPGIGLEPGGPDRVSPSVNGLAGIRSTTEFRLARIRPLMGDQVRPLAEDRVDAPQNIDLGRVVQLGNSLEEERPVAGITTRRSAFRRIRQARFAPLLARHFRGVALGKVLPDLIGRLLGESVELPADIRTRRRQ